jgi:hypothetical protein
MNALTTAIEIDDRFGHIAHLHVRIDPTRNREPDQFQFRMKDATGYGLSLSEHHGADFDSTNAVVTIERDGQRLGGKLLLRDVWKKFFGIEIDGMSPMGLRMGTPALSRSSPKYRTCPMRKLR